MFRRTDKANPFYRREQGFTLTEALVSSGVMAVMFAALLSGLTSSVSHVRFGREENRATQIMAEKLDTIRMYRWHQINPSYIPTSFSVSYLPARQSGSRTVVPALGVVYSGTISIQPAPVAEVYRDRLKEVTVRLQWQSGSRTVRREMTTLVGRNGLQDYVP